MGMPVDARRVRIPNSWAKLRLLDSKHAQRNNDGSNEQQKVNGLGDDPIFETPDPGLPPSRTLRSKSAPETFAPNAPLEPARDASQNHTERSLKMQQSPPISFHENRDKAHRSATPARVFSDLRPLPHKRLFLFFLKEATELSSSLLRISPISLGKHALVFRAVSVPAISCSRAECRPPSDSAMVRVRSRFPSRQPFESRAEAGAARPSSA